MDFFNIWTVATAAVIGYYILEYKRLEKGGSAEKKKEEKPE